MKYKLIIDITTDRIMWFSSDMNELVTPDEQSAVAFFEGELPTEMTRNNCWNYIFKNKQINLTNSKNQTEKPLLEINRESIKRFVKNTIYDKRTTKFPASIYDFFIHNSIKNEIEKNQPGLWTEVLKEAYSLELEKLVFLESQEMEMFLAKTEKLKIFTMKKLNSAHTNEELFEIKGKFLDALEKLN